MNIFYWAIIGVLVAFLAKVQVPTERDENLPVLLVMGVIAAVACGLLTHTLFRSGVLSMDWASHVAAFLGAALIVVGKRAATRQHLA
jgi:uncharacterized membrane protein YeaQ/YmgE (transglycosylase-associated protein family)